MSNENTDMNSGMWNIKRLYREVFPSFPQMVAWCQNVGLLLQNVTCKICYRNAQLKFSRTYRKSPLFRCHRSDPFVHDFCKSLFVGTWFDNSSLSIKNIIMFTYFFANKITDYETVIREISTVPTLITANHTVHEYLSLCRMSCLFWCIRQTQEQKMGGEGVIVEIIEAKVSQTEYIMDGTVKSEWLLGMTEVNSAGELPGHGGGMCRLVLCQNNKDSACLVKLITDNVLPGTVIVINLWDGFRHLTSHDLSHLTHRHSLNFMRTGTQAYGQIVESQFKSYIPYGKQIKRHLDLHIAEYVWRSEAIRLHPDQDIFMTFISLLAQVWQPKLD